MSIARALGGAHDGELNTRTTHLAIRPASTPFQMVCSFLFRRKLAVVLGTQWASCVSGVRHRGVVQVPRGGAAAAGRARLARRRQAPSPRVVLILIPQNIHDGILYYARSCPRSRRVVVTCVRWVRACREEALRMDESRFAPLPLLSLDVERRRVSPPSSDSGLDGAPRVRVFGKNSLWCTAGLGHGLRAVGTRARARL